jgi:hypothetical protein
VARHCMHTAIAEYRRWLSSFVGFGGTLSFAATRRFVAHGAGSK